MMKRLKNNNKKMTKKKKSKIKLKKKNRMIKREMVISMKIIKPECSLNSAAYLTTNRHINPLSLLITHPNPTSNTSLP